MGEALMFRAGGGSNGGGYELVTEIIESTKTFVAPSGVKDNLYSVLIFGGGGGGQYSLNKYYCGGGGGCMNKADITLNEGESVYVSIGEGGAVNNRQPFSSDGGTSFAWVRSLNGGTTSFGSYLSAAGGCTMNWLFDIVTAGNVTGGNGGSGGGCISFLNYSSGYWAYGGNATQFGGGGVISINASKSKASIGGSLGGNGGTPSTSAINGINTMAWTNIPIGDKGPGVGGGKNGGGGGFGANGGYTAGGGGGYGPYGKGGNGFYNSTNSWWQCWAGGGGGYGPGASYVDKVTASMGGGGCGGTHNIDNAYFNGASGVCIIQYYKKT